MMFEVAARSIVGRRPYQEDAYRVFDLSGQDVTEPASGKGGALCPGALVVVADGMGGEGGGELASTTVAQHFSEAFFKGDLDGDIPPRLQRAVEDANDALADVKQKNASVPVNAGTTLVAGSFQPGWMTFVSVGDSLLLRFRDDEVHKVNADHESGPHLDFRALITGTDDAWSHARRSEYRRHIMSAVMGREIAQVQTAVRPVQVGDIILFASDGLETLSMENLRRFVPHLAGKGVGAIADGLTDAITRIGENSQDNTTILVIRAVEDPQEAPTHIARR